MSDSEAMGIVKVAVIGAGAAGLCAAKHLGENEKFQCIVYEQMDCIGGTWVYTDGEHKDGSSIPSTMYKNLRTNLPVEIMTFLDFPFQKMEHSFVHRSMVLQYLQEYAEKNNLMKYIKLRHEVMSVTPITSEMETRWKITVKNLAEKTVEEEIFDAVMVCNGNYTEPNIPTIKGIENFNGTILHSYQYREPEAFKGKSVVILGSSFSALDISQEIAPFAEKVVVCDRSKKKVLQGFPENVKTVGNIISAHEEGFTLEDNTFCKADVLIYGTGYLYRFPFLSDGCKIDVTDNHVTPLYKQVVNIEHPTMSFIGIPHLVIPFILFDYQVQYYMKILEKKIELPAKEDMYRESEKDFELRRDQGIPKRYAHTLGKMENDYYDELADLAGLKKLPPVIMRIKNESLCSLRQHISKFKMYKYEILDDENYSKVLLW